MIFFYQWSIIIMYYKEGREKYEFYEDAWNR